MVKNTKKRLVVHGDLDFGYFLQHQTAIEEIQELHIDLDNEERVEEDDVVVATPLSKPEQQWKDELGSFYFGKATNKKILLNNLTKYIQSKDDKKIEQDVKDSAKLLLSQRRMTRWILR